MERIKLADTQELLKMDENALDEYVRDILENVGKISFSKLKDFCSPLKEYYRQNMQDIFPGTSSYDFLVYFFGKYHPEWEKKTHNCNVDFFRVERAQGFDTFCFYLYIDGIREDVGFNKIALRFRKINDIRSACREAVHPYILDLKRKILSTSNLRCPINNSVIDSSNMTIHHESLEFDEIVRDWVEIHGGEVEVFQYINETVGNGTITKFTNEELICDFVEYHNKHTKVCALSKMGHRIRHQEINDFKEGNSPLKCHPIEWYTLPINK